ncbi:glycosyltransferase family 4 protein [Candidatus Woesearchaeota archaeon]|nr:glycosyltransferase family 4 protein [Candidatus Woesearchaeota archaeon]
MNKMKTPRICYVNPPVLLKRPISEIINQLSAKGYKNSLITPKKLFRRIDDSLHHSKLADKSKVYTYSTLKLPFVSSEQPIPVSIAFFRNTCKALKNNNIIHMWVPYYFTNLKIIAWKKFFYPKKKLILTMDTVPGYSFSMGKFWDTMFWIYNKMFGWLIFRTPDIITLYGKSLIPYAIKAGMPKEKIRVLSTGIDIKKQDARIAEKNNSEIRKELGISKNTKVILFAGLLVPRKGIDKIIKIADKLRKEDAVFLLAGDGPDRKEYEAEAKKLGLEKKILFLGWRKDMHKLYQASNIFLLPAEGEGLPGVVMEAMSYGVPCVTSNIPCIPDLIDNGKSGFLCSKDDVNEFARRIKELFNNKKRNDFSRASLQKIKSFEWNKVIKKYEEMYRELYAKKD